MVLGQGFDGGAANPRFIQLPRIAADDMGDGAARVRQAAGEGPLDRPDMDIKAMLSE